MEQNLLKSFQLWILLIPLACLIFHDGYGQSQEIRVTGKVISMKDQEPLPGVSILIKGTSTGTITDVQGTYTIDVPSSSSVLVFSFIGYASQEIIVGGQSVINVELLEDVTALDEVVVVGYGEQKKESLTSAISSVKSEDIAHVNSATTSGLLAGKLPGLSFRMPDGRPGAGAMIQIRNMGNPLYVIDGIQKDAGQFNNLSPNDIESITILKDASAAIYGSRAANGVVLVTTKRGKLGDEPQVSINTYYGWQNWSRFPKGVNAYEWMMGRADAEMNQHGNTGITMEEIEKWREGTEYGYRSFDWYDFIVKGDAPQSSFNVNASGGSENTNYYLSVTRFDQKAVFSDEFEFNRTNIQSNVETRINDRLKVGVQINGRIERRHNPGVPGHDDYWQPRFALFRNRPTERPYANDNPEYPNNISNIETNWALLDYERTGWFKNDWRVLQTNFDAEYEIIDGLTARGLYSYYIADQRLNTFEYTYDVFTYDPVTEEYNRTGGNQNPYRDRRQRMVTENVMQGQLNYNNVFADKHNVGATFVVERIERRNQENFLHSVPTNNYLDLIQFADMDRYDDSDYEEARIGYVGRINYAYDRKYYVEAAARYDASWKFAPGERWGFFPSVSVGWRITEENFFEELGINVLDDLKLRASYGQLGDDNINRGIGSGNPRYISPFDYMSGYDYGVSEFINDGTLVIGSKDKGIPVTNISWFTSTMTDIGLDYSLLNGKLSGTFDYFYRKRTGLRGAKYDVLLPSELGYALPEENLETDAQIGGEASLVYNGNVGPLSFSVGANVGYSRSRFLESYKPRFGNSWDHYRNSREDRWNGIFWGHEVIGQFQSQEQINSYEVNIDGQGNTTLLPGDFIYKDVNDDGRINGYDVRPIGYSAGTLPLVNYGLNIVMTYKGFDFRADFSGASLASHNANWELRWPFQNGGNLLASMYDDRWHREDPFDPNSEWIAGKNPPLRFNNPQHSNYNKNSSWWLTNVNYLRLRTMELGYTLPSKLTERLTIEKCRVFANTYNLFSIDNLKDFGIDPEVIDQNGLQYPQNVLVNVGFNLTF